MYSRSFYPSETAGLPENYNGTAFAEPVPICEAESAEPSSTTEAVFPKDIVEEVQNEKEETAPAGLFGTSLFSGLFGGFGKGGSLGDSISSLLSNIGIEEILIIAVAAFLFFSKDGDSECAILLILLLFVK